MLQNVWFYLQTRLIKDDEGQGMVEYGLILALIAVAAIVALNTMSGGLDTILTKVSDTLTNAGN